MNISQKNIYMVLLTIACTKSVFAQGLSIEGTFSPQEILGRKEYLGYVKTRDRLSGILLRLYTKKSNAQKKYQQTRDPKDAQKLKDIERHIRSLGPVVHEFHNITDRKIHVRLVAGRGRKYDKLPRLKSNENVAEMLKRRPSLLGKDGTIVINAPHLASGKGAIASTQTKKSSRTRKSKKSKKIKVRGRVPDNTAVLLGNGSKRNSSRSSIRTSRLTPGSGGGILGTGP